MLPHKGVHKPISKLCLILAVTNLLAHNNINQICYCGQISLQSAAVLWQSCTFGGTIYFAVDCTYLFWNEGREIIIWKWIDWKSRISKLQNYETLKIAPHNAMSPDKICQKACPGLVHFCWVGILLTEE